MLVYFKLCSKRAYCIDTQSILELCYFRKITQLHFCTLAFPKIYFELLTQKLQCC